MMRPILRHLAIVATTIFVVAGSEPFLTSAHAAAPISPSVMFSDAKVQEAFDALVRQGAGFVTRTTSAGNQVVEVRLIGKQFDSSVIDRLRFFPDIEVLRFLDTTVGDEILKHLDQFAKLRSLGLFNSPITDEGLATLGASKTASELRQLLLGRTKVTDAGMKSVAKLPRLYLLEISGTAVTDAGIAALAPAPRLKVLRFRSTTVTDRGMDSLREVKTLLMMSVGGSKVTEAGIASLRKAIPGLVVTDEEITVNIEERP
jgi:hypothetical protein